MMRLPIIAIVAGSIMALPRPGVAELCDSTVLQLVYANGMRTALEDAVFDQLALHDFVKNALPGVTIRSSLAYDPNDIGTAAQFAVALEQRQADEWAVLEKANLVFDPTVQNHVVGYRAAIRNGSPVLVVAHSQGNFYTNHAYDILYSGKDALTTQSFAIVSVATPSDHVGGNGPWITLTNDAVINVIRLKYPSTLFGNAENTDKSHEDVPLHHGFRDSYLNGDDASNKIKEAIISVVRTLQPPPGPDGSSACATSFGHATGGTDNKGLGGNSGTTGVSGSGGAPGNGGIGNGGSGDSSAQAPLLTVTSSTVDAGGWLTLDCSLGPGSGGRHVAFFVTRGAAIVSQIQLVADGTGSASWNTLAVADWLADPSVGQNLSARCRNDSVDPVVESNWVSFCLATTCISVAMECGSIATGCGSFAQCGSCATQNPVCVAGGAALRTYSTPSCSAGKCVSASPADSACSNGCANGKCNQDGSGGTSSGSTGTIGQGGTGTGGVVGSGGASSSNHLWFTDFEEGWWPRALGEATLPNGIVVHDSGGPRLVTEVGTGNPGQALAWYGVDIYEPGETASFVLPPNLNVSQSLTLSFDAFLTADGPGDIQLFVKRGTCGDPRPLTLKRGAWRNISTSLPSCPDGNAVTVYVGEVSEFPSTAVALRVDNIALDVSGNQLSTGGSAAAGGTGGNSAVGGSSSGGTTIFGLGGTLGSGGPIATGGSFAATGGSVSSGGVASGGVTGGGTSSCLPSSESCANASIDNDCDGDSAELVDNVHEGDSCSTGKLGFCSAGYYACDGLDLGCIPSFDPTMEICGNSVDEDCDGFFDNGCLASCLSDIRSGKYRVCLEPNGDLYFRTVVMSVSDSELMAGLWHVFIHFEYGPPSGYSDWAYQVELSLVESGIARGFLPGDLPDGLCPQVSGDHRHPFRISEPHKGTDQNDPAGVWAPVGSELWDKQPGLLNTLPDQNLKWDYSVAAYRDVNGNWLPAATLAHDDMLDQQILCTP
jgi:hypothetical protein